MRVTILALASLIALAGCGTKTPERVEGGIATGAGTGAAVGLVGGPVGVVVGAAVGGVVGGVTAAETTPKQVNLGPTPWRDDRK